MEFLKNDEKLLKIKTPTLLGWGFLYKSTKVNFFRNSLNPSNLIPQQ